ncbi:MAG: GIDE domain-containing protein [Endomicrobiales bacterium]
MGFSFTFSGRPSFRRPWGLLALVPLAAFLLSFVPALLGITPPGSQQALFGYAHEVSLLAVGFLLFFFGFRELRKKWLVENTPTSRVRSAAMGVCELCGIAKGKTPLKSPHTGTDCVFYRFTAEKETRNSKGHTSWATVRDERSTAYFYVEDATGRLLVDPLGAEALLVKDFEAVEGGGIFSGRMRYREWFVKPGDYVYVLGTVKKSRDAAVERGERLRAKLRELKNDREKISSFDLDKDGQISIDEWDRARAALEQELLREELQKTPENGDDIVVAAGESEKTFIISDRDEEDVKKSIALRSFLCVFGGGGLAAVMAASLLARLGALSALPAIPWHALYR